MPPAAAARRAAPPAASASAAAAPARGPRRRRAAPRPEAQLARRAALGLGAAAAGLAAAAGGLPGPAAPRRQPAPAEAATRPPPAAAGMATAPPRPPPPRAVNLRDIGEVDPRLRRGVLFRCSQIYSPDVLRELRVRTVVDLRGRAERRARRRGRAGRGGGGGGGAAGEGSGRVGPPPVLAPAEVDALRREGVGGGGGGGGGGRAPDGPEAPGAELVATAVSAGSVGGGSDSDQPPPRRAGGASGGAALELEDVAAGLAGDDYDPQGPAAPETENFNLIPGVQFGQAMLRMPWRVWRSSLANLATGRDPRRPFVMAFADEQLMGFTKYYTLILEHSKHNIAAVLRVFADRRALPALVHCAHGKDRTGVIVMLLLLLCDVPHEAIVADYTQSEVELRRYRDSLGLGAAGGAAAAGGPGAAAAIIPLGEVIIASTQETLRALLSYLDAKYLSVENYLTSCGLTQGELAAIRANLLEPGAAQGGAQAAAGEAAEAPAGAEQAAGAAAAAAAVAAEAEGDAGQPGAGSMP